MDSRKDIYNLWVQYTTKNDETYFRQFIAGFVSIWHSQLQLDFENAPRWDTVAPDLGPHLSRLPDELLPAIEKFLIIARDGCENVRDDVSVDGEAMRENVLLVQCLTVICRHFENIAAVIKSSYISSCIAISNFIIDKLNDESSTDIETDVLFVKSVAQLLEVLYDPYLTWRSYLKGEHADYGRLSYKISPMHPEIVPFIYDCFQSGKVTKNSQIGKDLVHILGAHNGLRAISPATVTIIIDVIAKWESDADLRRLMLHCFSLMAVILQKSSPEQRQIDLLTIFQLYIGAIRDLLTTDHFLAKGSPVASFELSHDDDNYIDIGALGAAIASVQEFIPEHSNKLILCNALFEAKFLSHLVQIPEQVKKWNIDHQTLGTVLVKTLQALCNDSDKMQYNVMHTNNINVLFDGLKGFGKPSANLINQCLGFAFDETDRRQVNPAVVTKLIEWIPMMGENEQNMLSEVLLKKCAATMQSKQHVCSQKTIKLIVDKCLSDSNRLSAKCTINLLKLVEELAKYSILPAEVNSLFRLLRDEMQFEYRKQLLETILRVSHHRATMGTMPDSFLDIQSNTSGITIPEIRKWDTTHGFVFHTWLRLEEESSMAQNYRRQLFSLTTTYGTGYEFFVQKNGNFVVSVITKKEFFTATAQSPQLLDGRWHSVTVSVVPPKRLFSYHQINVYIDSVQKLGSTMKYASFAEVFHYCSIGAPYNNFRKLSHTSHQSNSARMSPVPDGTPGTPSAEREERQARSGGLFPNIIERTFFPGLVSQVPNYFTLPSKSTSSLDPSVKSYPIGMQDLVFGEAICLKGQLGAVLLADTNVNLKSLFEAGPNVANVLATDIIESFDMASKFVFAFAPNACFDGLCLDLAPGNQYNGHLVASVASTLSLQNTLNGIGGMVVLLPILDSISRMPDGDIPSSNELISLSPVESPLKEENFGDWEMLQLNSLTEAKIIQNPIACFLCLLRNFINGSELNKKNVLKNDVIAIVSSLLQQCNERLFDVNVLMAVQLLIESIQNEMPSGNMELLHVLLRDLVFNFRIWAKAQFQIVIGHIQYISTIIKDDRKYFRRHFGIQYMLDVIQEHFTTGTTLPPQDAKMVRESLLRIVKYYLQKEVNINEISSVLNFLTATKHEATVEIIDMLILLIEGKHVNDQLFLLMYEPHMADAMYTLFIDRHFGAEVHTKLIKFITGMLNTKRISSKHKAALRLYTATVECHSLYPGLFPLCYRSSWSRT
ncbi:AGAP003395-PA-like protein [Anopheles sinensis]|uniref:AGAP003395-PA-like protein n=1 Tax=Anopheles sinensis TaxID=74873 RepID=A0A084VZZ5_ANOSI|nr:AGAP003395-PA-like protein [Anopheles sinensis]